MSEVWNFIPSIKTANPGKKLSERILFVEPGIDFFVKLFFIQKLFKTNIYPRILVKFTSKQVKIYFDYYGISWSLMYFINTYRYER
jgi:hypothetical protein